MCARVILSTSQLSGRAQFAENVLQQPRVLLYAIHVVSRTNVDQVVAGLRHVLFHFPLHPCLVTAPRPPLTPLPVWINVLIICHNKLAGLNSLQENAVFCPGRGKLSDSRILCYTLTLLYIELAAMRAVCSSQQG